jgi:hypothetical protein
VDKEVDHCPALVVFGAGRALVGVHRFIPLLDGEGHEVGERDEAVAVDAVQVHLELPQSARWHLTKEKLVASPDAFLEQLRHPLVDPDGEVVTEDDEGELMKGLVAERAAERIEALMVEERRQNLLLRHEYAAGVTAGGPDEGKVIALALEQARCEPLSGRVRREAS